MELKQRHGGSDTQIATKQGYTTRMLCPTHGMQEFIHQDENDQCFLECRCKRTPGLLDPAPGHLSLENIIAGDPVANRLFPIQDANGFKPRGRDITDILGDYPEAA